MWWWMAGCALMIVLARWLRQADPPLHCRTAVDWAVWLSTVHPASGPWWSGLLPAHEVHDDRGNVYHYKRWRGTRFGLKLVLVVSRDEYLAMQEEEQE